MKLIQISILISLLALSACATGESTARNPASVGEDQESCERIASNPAVCEPVSSPHAHRY